MTYLAFTVPIDFHALSSGEVAGISVALALTLLALIFSLFKIFKGSYSRIIPAIYNAELKKSDSSRTKESFLKEFAEEREEYIAAVDQSGFNTLRKIMLALGAYTFNFHVNYPYWVQRLSFFYKKRLSSLGSRLMQVFSRKAYVEGKLFTYMATRVFKDTFELLWSGDLNGVGPVEIRMNSKKIGTIDLGQCLVHGDGVEFSYTLQGVYKNIWIWPSLEAFKGREKIAEIVLKPRPSAVWKNRLKFFLGQDHGLTVFAELPAQETYDPLLFALGIFYETHWNATVGIRR